MPYPENSLARRFLESEPEALGQVIRWISAGLTVPRFWILRREWPDLMQEVLARTLESLRHERFNPSRDFRVYVQGIARIVCLQALGEQATALKREVAADRADGGAVDPTARVIRRQLVRRVLELASEECRELFRLYYLEGRDYGEIAVAAGIPIGTVKSRLFRCLESAHHALASSEWRSRVERPDPHKDS